MSFEVAALLAAWLTIAVLSLAMAGLYARVRDLAPGPAGPGRPAGGSFAPSMSDGRVPADTLVLFLSTTCPLCRDLVAEAAALGREGALPGAGVLAVFAVDGEDDIPPWAAVDGIRTRADRTFAERFRVVATPTAAYVDPDGVVVHLSPVASTERFRDAVRRLAAVDEATDGVTDDEQRRAPA